MRRPLPGARCGFRPSPWGYLASPRRRAVPRLPRLSSVSLPTETGGRRGPVGSDPAFHLVECAMGIVAGLAAVEPDLRAGDSGSAD
jgi:hypothetical protein